MDTTHSSGDNETRQSKDPHKQPSAPEKSARLVLQGVELEKLDCIFCLD